MRKSNGKTTLRSLIIGGIIFTFLVSIPVLANFLPSGDDEEVLDQKITTVKLPPKEKPKEN
jgi:protein TonB